MAKKDKKKKKDNLPKKAKRETIEDSTITAEEMAITVSMQFEEAIKGKPPTRILSTLDTLARTDIIAPNESIDVHTPAGLITIKKGTSSTPGKERIYWYDGEEKLAKVDLAKTMREAASNQAVSKDPQEEPKEDGPSTKELETTYKKKQVISAVKLTFKKKIVKAIKAQIPEKVLTGAEMIAAIDDANGEETPLEKIKEIFAAL